MHGKASDGLDDQWVEPEEVGEERARELFHYYRPPKEAARDGTVFLPYPDTVLQAHAQLAALRLDVQRAMIGLVDKRSSYFVAEATKSLDLEDVHRSEYDNDGQWYGSMSMPKKGGLVEWTLAQEPHIVDGQEIPAHYEVLDMTKDSRWRDNPFVTAEPYFRYYCGLPLRTENDINIGALFLLDDRPRDSTSRARLKVLYTIAHNIMVHMKTVREAHEKQRAIHMNMCMADFISPEYRFRVRQCNPRTAIESPCGRAVDREHDESPQQTTPRIVTGEEYGSFMTEKASDRQAHGSESYDHPVSSEGLTATHQQQAELISVRANKLDAVDCEAPEQPLNTAVTGDDAVVQKYELSAGFDEQADLVGTPLNSPATSQRGRSTLRKPCTEPSASGPDPRKSVTEADHQRTFDRAAYLLRQALDLSDSGGGGVVLLDTNALADSKDPILRRADSDYKDVDAEGSRPCPSPLQSPGNRSPNAGQFAYSGAMRERVVLAAASVSVQDGPPQNYGRADPLWVVTLTPPELQRMCKKHTRGRLYNIPEQVGTSLLDYEGRPIAGRLSSRFFELVLLRRQFPQAKQVIFVPMFHANLNRWTSCFAFTNSRYRVFSYEMDYLPMLSFTNAIKAEIVRLATVFADQQKSDFIGSVSHELRSPLHGILASVEFLQETELDTFQSSCINTMDACAHTLLDTVAMVLDYSKVNTLKRKASDESECSSQGRLDRSDSMPSSSGIRNEPLFATDQYCDVARITEEVIDGLAIGHLAKVRTNFGFDDTIHDLSASFPDVNPSLRRILQAVRPEVELILDIEPPVDWSFSTQPGAIRRIVMNLLSNSLKYTKHGVISVSLQRAPASDDQMSSVKFFQKRPTVIKIRVTDTGQGISPEYLRSKVFTPFAQENAKAAGTGLGLSIVRSIVNALSGEIDIKSIVNVGTIVVVTLPMKPPRTASYSSATTPRVVATPSAAEFTLISPQSRQKDSVISTLQSFQGPPQAAIYEPALEHNSFGQTQGAAHIHSALVQYLTGWYGFPTLQTWDFDCPATLLIVDEIHLPTLLARRPHYLDTLSLQSIIILCANPTRQGILTKDIRSRLVEVICKPFGPYKLARTVSRALEKISKSPTTRDQSSTPREGQCGMTSGPTSPKSPKNVRPSKESETLSPDVDRRSSERAGAESSTSSERIFAPHRACQATPRGFGETRGGTRASAGGEFPFPHGRRREGSSAAVQQVISSTSKTSTGLDRDRASETIARSSQGLVVGSGAPTHASMEVDQNGRSGSGLSRHDDSSSENRLYPEQTQSPTRRPRLLLVDDNRLNLQLLRTYVAKIGYDASLARTAENGEQAVAVFKDFHPDIVFMDISMPVMDGNESARRIRSFEAEKVQSSQAASTPRAALIVALTGNAKGSDQKEAYDSGMNMYMTKPISFREVGGLLARWMEDDRAKC